MEKIYSVIRQLGTHASRPNPKDPKWVRWMQQGIQLARQIQGRPDLPQDVGSIVSVLLHDIIAMPEVSGIKTTVQGPPQGPKIGNKWESMNPTLPPLWYKRYY